MYTVLVSLSITMCVFSPPTAAYIAFKLILNVKPLPANQNPDLNSPEVLKS